ncbi:GNAT family N-acetyltransferase [Panacibacter sp. DH6]|uniref:GNAT family N-acetyltransferase n=1 Tax=Panacibacter microcysteis TaxID=2793269 RepID=A0A931GZ32_9BACT|nr:GNAT family N-acetyltransferase [Panacibacter microcysteis]MBG9377995.1 GNAT family N-acetyltransferase [Panacibacter microcysteis]
MMPQQIITERLELNLISEEDYAFVQELVNTEGWIKFIGDRNVHSPADAVRYIQKIMQTPQLFYWVATIKTTKEKAGIISFMKRSYLDNYDIGFAFLPRFHKSGYALEGARALLTLVQEAYGHETVVATTIPGNLASISLLTKMGFTFKECITQGGEQLNVYQHQK